MDEDPDRSSLPSPRRGRHSDLDDDWGNAGCSITPTLLWVLPVNTPFYFHRSPLLGPLRSSRFSPLLLSRISHHLTLTVATFMCLGIIEACELLLVE